MPIWLILSWVILSLTVSDISSVIGDCYPYKHGEICKKIKNPQKTMNEKNV